MARALYMHLIGSMSEKPHAEKARAEKSEAIGIWIVLPSKSLQYSSFSVGERLGWNRGGSRTDLTNVFFRFDC